MCTMVDFALLDYRRRGRSGGGDCFGISADETFVAFPNDIGFATSDKRGIQNGVEWKEYDLAMSGEIEKVETHLKIPVFTIARTTAFIPALSPPDVSTANRILCVLGASSVMVSLQLYVHLYPRSLGGERGFRSKDAEVESCTMPAVLDVPGGVRGQEEHGFGNIVRRANPLHRYRRRQCLQKSGVFLRTREDFSLQVNPFS